MKKKYISPELEIVILEQSDIITGSVSGDPVDKPGTDTGIWDEDEGWD
ncbi:MAG: hypothetical protein IJX82_07770 [Clostridia bacterium]|nr:hypothetical protein [Clostridia bacterium]